MSIRSTLGIRSVSRVLIVGAAVALAMSTGLASAQPSRSPGWRVVYRNAEDSFLAVTATAPNNAWAAGFTRTSQPFVRHWNGRSWGSATLPAGVGGKFGGFLQVLAGSSASNAWAFGEDFGVPGPKVISVVLRWDGKRWSQLATPLGDVVIGGAAVFSAADVWVFGCPDRAGDPGAGTWHYNGRHWTLLRLGNDDICSGSALSSRDIWATGVNLVAGGTFITHWNGTRWSHVKTPPVTLSDGKRHTFLASSVQAISDRNVWAFGNASIDSSQGLFGGVLHWNGHSWRQVSLPGAITAVLNSAPDGQGGLWVTAHYTTGAGPELHFTGGRWVQVALPRVSGRAVALNGLALVPHTTSVWGVSANSHVILKDGP